MYFRVLILATIWVVLAYAAPQGQCPKGQHWVRAHFRRAYYRGDGTYVRATNVTAHCSTNQSGYDIWNAKLLDGRPSFWQPDEKTANWTPEERERVLEALGELPRVLKDERINGFYRLKQAALPKNPASNNFSDIVVYDAAFSRDYNLTQVLGHELSHRLYGLLTDHEKDSFQMAGKWKLTKKQTYEVGRPKSEFLRSNAMLNPEEDFCDIIPAYFLQPAKLKAISPRLFQWADNHVKIWSAK